MGEIDDIINEIDDNYTSLIDDDIIDDIVDDIIDASLYDWYKTKNKSNFKI